MTDQYYEGSRLYSAVRRWNDGVHSLGQGYRSSRLKRVFDRLERVFGRLADVTRQSRLVRWLTAEPEPDVIVVDLRETWTVGPIIGVLDRLLPYGERTWNGSGVRQALNRIATAFENAPVQLASALVLAVLVVQFALTRRGASRLSLGLLCLLAAPAILGLRVTWTLDELEASRVGRLANALLVPPELVEDEN